MNSNTAGKSGVPFLPILYDLGTFLYTEFVLHLLLKHSFSTLLYPLLFCIPLAALTGLFCSFFKRKGAFVSRIVIYSVAAVWTGVQLIYFKIFGVNLTLYSFTVGFTQGFGFADAALLTILKNFYGIFLILLPLVLFCIFGRKWFAYEPMGWLKRIQLALVGVVVYLCLLLVIQTGSHDLMSAYDLFYENNDITQSIDKLGLFTATRLDVHRLIFGFEEDGLDLELEPVIESLPESSSESSSSENSSEKSSESESESSEPETEPEETVVIDTSPNVIAGLDLDELLADAPNDTIATLTQYFQTVTPTNKNEYTGMFDGYDLIEITAEGFSPYCVDPELTPTLYRLVNGGFHFSNFYVPVWGVSTSDGEYVHCTSLVPKSGVWSMYRSGLQGNDMRFCLGSMFSAQGYETYAYHDHTYDYYGRDLSHPNMGYTYKGVGNGLDVKTTWPESDLEMMEKTVDEYINADHFMTYYMTVSGHLYYTFTGNAMATKNKALVEDLDYSEEAKAYLACQIELDRALEYLINRLEEAGRLDTTVIVLVADHYPYGLSEETISEFLGHTVETTFEKYKSNLILWNSAMEETVEVEKPCCQMDILPTVLNLFGMEYDSRFLMGKDILSDSEPFVLFADTSFITDICRYNANTGEVEMLDEQYQVDPDLEVDLPENYITSRRVHITNMFKISAAILDNDYYSYLPDAVAREIPDVRNSGSDTVENTDGEDASASASGE